MIVRTPLRSLTLAIAHLRGAARRPGVQHSLVMSRHNSAPVELDRSITHINA
jgi:hypothetical protein